MNHKILPCLICTALLAGCNGTNTIKNGNNGTQIKGSGPTKSIGISKAQADKLNVTYYNRGIKHGLSIGIINMLVSTRNFDVVWETALQDLSKNPSLVPYLIGFLDTVNGDTSTKRSEERRVASNKNYAPRLLLPKKAAEQQIRDRCVLVLARMIPLAQDSVLGNKLIPKNIKKELREAMERELKFAGPGERRKNILAVKNFVKTTKSVIELLKTFNEAVNKDDWRLVGITMSALKGSRDPKVQVAFLKAFKKLYSKRDQPEPALCGALLRNTADISNSNELFNLACRATIAGQPFDIRNAGLYSLGRFSRSKSHQRKAIDVLASNVKRPGSQVLRITAVRSLGNFTGGPGARQLRQCRSKIKAQKREQDQELLKEIDAAIAKASKGPS